MAKVDFGHLQRTSVELTEHATYFLPISISTFTLTYSTLKNYLVLSIKLEKSTYMYLLMPWEVIYAKLSSSASDYLFFQGLVNNN